MLDKIILYQLKQIISKRNLKAYCLTEVIDYRLVRDNFIHTKYVILWLAQDK